MFLEEFGYLAKLFFIIKINWSYYVCEGLCNVGDIKKC